MVDKLHGIMSAITMVTTSEAVHQELLAAIYVLKIPSAHILLGPGTFAGCRQSPIQI